MFKNQSFEINKILQRLELLEEKVFKKPKRISATRSQRVLMLKQLGILEKIDEMNLLQKQKANLLAVLLDSDPENIEKDLSQIHRKDSRLITLQNFTILEEVYRSVGLEKLSKESEKAVIRLRQSEK